MKRKRQYWALMAVGMLCDDGHRTYHPHHAVIAAVTYHQMANLSQTIRVVWGHPNVFSQLFASTLRVVCKHACASTRHYCTLVSDYLLKTWIHTHTLTHLHMHASSRTDGHAACINTKDA